jgi:8-oxo-dGTP diphosphatase
MHYKSPKLTADGAILKENKILLIKRKNNPFKNMWALPGGFVEYNEKVEDAVIREVLEETGLNTKIIDLIGIYSDPNRDPRGHVVTVVYLLKIEKGDIKGGDDALEAKFFEIDDLPDLSFDHDIIISDINRRIKKDVLSKM